MIRLGAAAGGGLLAERNAAHAARVKLWASVCPVCLGGKCFALAWLVTVPCWKCQGSGKRSDEGES